MTQVSVDIYSEVGEFAEDKDSARRLREQVISPALDAGSEVVIDFSGSPFATQSFIHALISSVIREYGPEILDRIVFHGTTDAVRGLVTIVAQYSQEPVE